jgi:hypothetical protein
LFPHISCGERIHVIWRRIHVTWRRIVFIVPPYLPRREDVFPQRRTSETEYSLRDTERRKYGDSTRAREREKKARESKGGRETKGGREIERESARAKEKACAREKARARKRERARARERERARMFRPSQCPREGVGIGRVV